MGSGGFLPATSSSPAFIGSYEANTYPNPIEAVTPPNSLGVGWTINTKTVTEEANPELRQAGDIGDVKFFSELEGPF